MRPSVPQEVYKRSLRHPSNGMKFYRLLFLEAKLVNIFSSNLLGFGEGCGLIILAFLLYYLFGLKAPLFEKIIGFLLFLGIGIYLTFMIFMFGQFYVEAGEVLGSWKRNYIGQTGIENQNQKWEIERRTINSLQHLKMYAGEAYYFDQKSRLVLWEAIVDKTILLFALYPVRWGLHIYLTIQNIHTGKYRRFKLEKHLKISKPMKYSEIYKSIIQ